ncbi:hypothetical protein BGZ81_003960 [Podila clonocystis]|nr:hypothetical protein BGZ81_003960 [Podila clonocystis]
MGVFSIITYLSLVRTVFHAPVPYELYNRVDPATGIFYRRTDITFRPSKSYPGTPVVASPLWRVQGEYTTEACLDIFLFSPTPTSGNNTIEPCQCTQEQYDRDMRDFYRQIDNTFYAPASSSKAVYPPDSMAELFGRFQLPPRILFDLTFIPGRNALTEWVTLIFAGYLSMDIVVGLVYYREKITFMSGYFHHTLHLLMCAIAFYCNTIDNLVIFLLVEVPTSILALGFMFPRFRNDKLFGVLFFIIRIVIDVLMSHEMLRNTSMGNAPKIMTAFKVPLNFKLFFDFIGQQKRLSRRQGQQQKDASKKRKMASMQPLASIEGKNDLYRLH